MRIIRNSSSCPAACKNAVIALGNFDGVHLGHQAILRRCIEIAKAEGVPSAVMTFEPHPREFFSGKELRIYSFRQKAEILREMGIDILFVIPFNARFASLSAETFVHDILHKQLAVRHVVTGHNFAFGKARQGDTNFLTAEAKKLRFGFTACPPVDDTQHHVISSSAIRDLLAAGDVKKAASLLGRPYEIEGHVRHGEKRGRTLGFPTANLSLHHLFKPRFGIYAVRMAVGTEKKEHDAVASLGIRPTFDHKEALLEVHGLAMNRDLYGQRLRVRFIDFLREEKRFPDAETLQKQMALDCIQAKEILADIRVKHA